MSDNKEFEAMSRKELIDLLHLWGITTSPREKKSSLVEKAEVEFAEQVRVAEYLDAKKNIDEDDSRVAWAVMGLVCLGLFIIFIG